MKKIFFILLLILSSCVTSQVSYPIDNYSCNIQATTILPDSLEVNTSKLAKYVGRIYWTDFSIEIEVYLPNGLPNDLDFTIQFGEKTVQFYNDGWWIAGYKYREKIGGCFLHFIPLDNSGTINMTGKFFIEFVGGR